jgi:molybdate/tungstate transport system substrate-binding protein
VFHAGSLVGPFADVASTHGQRRGARVTREASGSVEATAKLTQQGRYPDVLAVADVRLLRDRVLPSLGNWLVVFATNAMAIMHRPEAHGGAEISTENWWEVLAREDVRIGHADPALDPGGYRAVLTLQLGAIPFEGDRLYDGATVERLRRNATVAAASEHSLGIPLESGDVDYVLTYRSLAEQSDFPVVRLQPQVDLSAFSAAHAAHYAAASVSTDSGTFTGAPIAYAMTVPSRAGSPDAGARFVDAVLSDGGQRALRDHGFTPIDPVVNSDGRDAVPDAVGERATASESLGPLRLDGT